MSAAAPQNAVVEEEIPDVPPEEIPHSERVYGLKVIALELAHLWGLGADEVSDGTTVRRRAEKGRLLVKINGKPKAVLYQDPLSKAYWAPRGYLRLFARQNPVRPVGNDNG